MMPPAQLVGWPFGGGRAVAEEGKGAGFGRRDEGGSPVGPPTPSSVASYHVGFLKMPLTRYAFIVKGPGYAPERHVADFQSELFRTRIVGVSDLASAIDVARRLVDEGIQLIELCGGFRESEAREVREGIGNAIPVGVVLYDDAQAAELERRFA